MLPLPPDTLIAAPSPTGSDAVPLTVYWNIIVRRKRLIVVGCLLGVIGGFLVFRRQFPIPTPVFGAIEIGNVGELLESSDLTRQKLVDVILPEALLMHAKEQGYGENLYRIDVEVGEKAPYVRLEANGAGSALDDIRSIMANVFEKLLTDHEQIFARRKRTLEDDLNRLEREFAVVEAEKKFFPGRRERIKVTARLLEEQIDGTRRLIASMREQRATLLNAEARRAETEQSLATAILLIDNDIQANFGRLGSLEERLNIATKVDMEALERAIAENERMQIEKRTEIDRVKRDIAFTRPTRVVIAPTTGLRAVAASWERYVLIGAILGCVFGALAALFAEFTVRAKAERAVSRV
ncbi:hypothetical protein HY635_02680 [Candidatus Uhrbacteria bacterium]|nr:hypothetical protein [Candidatus Uhrbacteria bacterium]